MTSLMDLVVEAKKVKAWGIDADLVEVNQVLEDNGMKELLTAEIGNPSYFRVRPARYSVVFRVVGSEWDMLRDWIEQFRPIGTLFVWEIVG